MGTTALVRGAQAAAACGAFGVATFVLGSAACTSFTEEPPSDGGSAAEGGPTSDAGADSGGLAICAKGTCRLIFVTSKSTSAKLGGLPGGDAFCQKAVSESTNPAVKTLGRKFKAWLSTAANPAAARHENGGIPYRRFDGVVVANDWGELIGTDVSTKKLQNPIDVDENGGKHAMDLVWTGTTANGQASDNTCADWTSTAAPAGQIGRTDQTFEGWTDGDVPLGISSPCTTTNRLYCIEE
jgi:hypothetical protein